MEEKVAHIPEDRHKRGVVLPMNIRENVILMNYYKPPLSNGTFLNWPEIDGLVDQILVEYQVKTPNRDELIKNLSGGNQQKVVLARELSKVPKFLIAMHPSRGLDIGATEYVHKRIIAERDKGCAVLLISTELDEIISLSDRINVIYEGQIMGEIAAKDANVHDIGLMMAGTRQEELAKHE